MSLNLEIVTPRGVVFQATARHVKLPGSAGEFGLLTGHIPFMTTLQTGVIELDVETGKPERVAISAGFVEVLPNKVVILAETAETAESIDLTRAEAARKRAEEGLRTSENPIERERFHSAVMRARARIKAGSGTP